MTFGVLNGIGVSLFGLFPGHMFNPSDDLEAVKMIIPLCVLVLFACLYNLDSINSKPVHSCITKGA